MVAKSATEHAEQSALMAWAGLQSKAMPDLSMLFAIPNGGARTLVTGAMLKREGVKKGIPDLFLACPRRACGGLFIEMKRKCGVPSDVSQEQRQWLAKFISQGYQAEVCNGADEAKAVILKYLG